MDLFQFSQGKYNYTLTLHAITKIIHSEYVSEGVNWLTIIIHIQGTEALVVSFSSRTGDLVDGWRLYNNLIDHMKAA